MPGCFYNILLLCTGGIQARILSDKCSERKNLVSALLHPGFLHHWLWFAQILADTGQISREISRVNIYIRHSNTVHNSLLLEQNLILKKSNSIIMVEVVGYTIDNTEDHRSSDWRELEGRYKYCMKNLGWVGSLVVFEFYKAIGVSLSAVWVEVCRHQKIYCT